ncbi:hypothetical protein CUJ84_Chr001052 [Rhizobium leguminosarum]|uniref:Uncharacterized protein n=1 Tax=Rhizobium leguminosarum TaxID=384 RepID=A0A2K9YZM6_RHILE|nr:hypothetical protein CUJ84_Chr001052 [Rhizobium leguminosarum]
MLVVDADLGDQPLGALRLACHQGKPVMRTAEGIDRRARLLDRHRCLLAFGLDLGGELLPGVIGGGMRRACQAKQYGGSERLDYIPVHIGSPLISITGKAVFCAGIPIDLLKRFLRATPTLQLRQIFLRPVVF